MTNIRYRIEEDALGQLQVPAEAYYGIQTQRAIDNFHISGQAAEAVFVWATAAVKKAAALANIQLGRLDQEIGQAIVRAAGEVLAGKLGDQFVVDVYQAGAGTSHNMNANEVITNRALEILGEGRGHYQRIHPNDHVNMAQSTNDVFPTAMRVAILRALQPLMEMLRELGSAFAGKSEEFKDILKSGRTHLQDAVPVTLGQEFSAYAAVISAAHRRIERTSRDLGVLGIGGSAAGTGLNTHPEYRFRLIENLKQITDLELSPADKLFHLMQSMADFAGISGELKNLALELIKICNDLRLLASGPRTGLAEIVLPPVQPGSSIMPGKVNPVMAEMLNMVCFQVAGNDLTVSMASQAGQLELNVMMPVIVHNILSSTRILTNGGNAFCRRCVKGISANPERCLEYMHRSVALVTALAPYIGYQEAAKLAKESECSGKSVYDLALEKKILSAEQLREVLSPRRLTNLT